MDETNFDRRLTTVLRAMGWAYILFDYEGNYLAWKKGPGRDFLKSDEEMTGANFQTIGLPEDIRRQLAIEMALAIDNGRMREFFYEGERDGKWCRFMNRLVPIPENREVMLFLSEVKPEG